MTALEMLDALDDKLFQMSFRAVDANDVAELLADVRAARDKVASELA